MNDPDSQPMQSNEIGNHVPFAMHLSYNIIPPGNKEYGAQRGKKGRRHDRCRTDKSLEEKDVVSRYTMDAGLAGLRVEG